MFGHKSLPTKNYVYGAFEPTMCADEALAQLKLGHHYRNELCALERLRRDEYHAVLHQSSTEVQRLTAEVEQLEVAIEEQRNAMKQANAAARRRVQTPGQRASIAESLARLKDVRAQLKTAKVTARNAAKPQLKQLDEQDSARHRAARADFVQRGLYHGTYLTIEHHAASFKKGPPPQFARWSGEGTIGIQIQDGITPVEAVLGYDSRFKIRLNGSFRGGKKFRGEVWLRIGSEGRKNMTPVWAVFPFVYHRPLPDDAKIKWVMVQRFRVGSHWKWQVVLSVSRESWPMPDAARDGAVGIDVNWRLLPEGLRIASWVGSDGREGEWVIPRERLNALDQNEWLQGIRDSMFNATVTELLRWLSLDLLIPDWLREKTETLAQWRSANRLAALVLFWGRNRFAGDEHIFLALEGWREGDCYAGWRKQDRHLWDWQSNARQKNIDWRDDYYRKLVVELRRQYRTVAIEDINWAELAKKPEVEVATDGNDAQRRYRQFAAPGKLAGYIAEGFAEVVRVDPAYTTQRCCECGELDTFDSEKEVVRTCQYCGVRMDQDKRAARNLLAAVCPVCEQV